MTAPALPTLAAIRQWAQALGFADAGLAIVALDDDMAHLSRWLAAGYQGQMEYLARHADKRASPAALHPGTVTVISVRLDYKPDAQAADAVLANGDLAYISRYALGRDYHKLMRGRLRKLGQRIADAIAPHGYRVLCDSAPALEKPLARNAGLGWVGKHSLVLNRQAGSWFYLGELYTDMPIAAAPTAPVSNLCGSCSKCLTACPTDAFVAPGVLDARRCISYLTIEHRGAIPVQHRRAMGNRIFGCDDCQLACPWNRYAVTTPEPDFAPRHGLDSARLLDLWAWDDTQFLARTEGMALRRLDHARWLRNLAIALGNAPASQAIIEALLQRAEHTDDAVREHVAWAIAEQQQKLGGLTAPLAP